MRERGTFLDWEGPLILSIVRSMRPRQWTKNAVLLLPLAFSGELRQPTKVLYSLGALGIFCLLSGAVYLFNDARDAQVDRLHEKKRLRPVASGELTPRAALIASVLLAACSLGASLWLGSTFTLVSVGYLALQLGYTLYLKHEVILDVMSIGAGFILRVVAGAVAVSVYVSPWLVACTGLLALFLGFAKRRSELSELEESAVGHRRSLEHYSTPYLDSMIATATSSTVVAYTLYTVISPAAVRAPGLIMTTPFVVYGLFRYLYLVHIRDLGGSPEEILLTDRPLMIDIAAWGLVVVIAVYIG